MNVDMQVHVYADALISYILYSTTMHSGPVGEIIIVDDLEPGGYTLYEQHVQLLQRMKRFNCMQGHANTT